MTQTTETVKCRQRVIVIIPCVCMCVCVCVCVCMCVCVCVCVCVCYHLISETIRLDGMGCERSGVQILKLIYSLKLVVLRHLELLTSAEKSQKTNYAISLSNSPNTCLASPAEV